MIRGLRSNLQHVGSSLIKVRVGPHARVLTGQLFCGNHSHNDQTRALLASVRAQEDH